MMHSNKDTSYFGGYHLGRGRGVLPFSVPCTPGKLNSTDYDDYRVHFSTPVSHDIPPLEMSLSEPTVVLSNEQVKQLSSDISQSIKASLFSSSQLPTSTSVNDCQRCSQVTQCGTTIIDASKMNLVLKSGREPPYFRGDSSDKCSVFEWEELMRAYLEKGNYSGLERIDEIINKLMGRARDVIQIWLRNSASVSRTGDVDMVFRVLKQHFGGVISTGLPMADFYATKPYHNEGPFDYWIRLNKAADLAEQHLKSEGRTLQNRDMELAVMFIRNCPDKGLSMMFLSKPQREWTAAEVQDRLDEFVRDRKVYECQLSQQTVSPVIPDVGGTPPGRTQVSVEPNNPTCDSNTMDRMLNMLEKALTCNAQSSKAVVHRKPNVKRPQVCRVCQSLDHSTVAHCRLHKLCFTCYLPGHTRDMCEMSASQVRPNSSTAAVDGHSQKPPQGNY